MGLIDSAHLKLGAEQYSEYEQVAEDLEDQRWLWLEEEVPKVLRPLNSNPPWTAAQAYTCRVRLRGPHIPRERMTTGFAFLGAREKCGYNARLVREHKDEKAMVTELDKVQSEMNEYVVSNRCS